MSGVEQCWEARLVATCRPRRLIEALDSGADEFIGKPPLAEELYARLRAASGFSPCSAS
jgi:two-component system, cell cycle response regulator